MKRCAKQIHRLKKQRIWCKCQKKYLFNRVSNFCILVDMKNDKVEFWKKKQFLQDMTFHIWTILCCVFKLDDQDDGHYHTIIHNSVPLFHTKMLLTVTNNSAKRLQNLFYFILFINEWEMLTGSTWKSSRF